MEVVDMYFYTYLDDTGVQHNIDSKNESKLQR